MWDRGLVLADQLAIVLSHGTALPACEVNRPGFTGGSPALSLAGGSPCEVDGALSHFWETLEVRILGVCESGGTPQWIQLASVGRLSPNWLGDLELPAVNRHLLRTP